MRREALLAVFLLAHCVPVFAQIPDFSGTWKLDPARSRITAAAGLVGLIPAGAPETLHVTQPANGTLIIESRINESHSRMFRPGGKTSTPAGPSATIAMASKWNGRSLVSEGTLESVSGASTTVKEVFSVSADGRELTVDVTTTGAAGASASTLIYTRSQTVEPCQNWPTPCKNPVR